jgi:polyisoprenoid-binding protein YceI
MKYLLIGLLSIGSALAAVDLTKSEFTWTGKKVAGPHFGKVPLKSATLVEEKGMIKSGEFVIEIGKMSVEDIQGEWADKLKAHLISPDFFNVEKFPTATLKVKSVKGSTVTADLTIKGKTNTVTFDAVKKDGAYTGKLEFDRTKFDMVYNSGNFFKDLGDKVIEDKVTVDFKVVQN